MNRATKETLGYVVNGISIAAFFYLSSVVRPSVTWPFLRYIGWALLALGVFLVAGSTLTLIRNRGTGLVDTGVYGLVRHPMYVGAIVLFVSWVFFIPHWTTLLLSLVNSAVVYWYVLLEDRRNMDHFGAEYGLYAEKVPRANIVAGAVKSLRKGP